MRNKKLAAKFRGLKCIACSGGPTVGDHIFAFARDTDKDIEENMWPLCIPCHDEKGRGLVDFVKKYGLEKEMLNRNCWFDGRRWRRHFKDMGDVS